jgi:hypothetical protein
MSDTEWKIEQPPVAEMMCPVRCVHCRGIYSLTHVHVTGRYTDCSVWTSPCCGVAGIDDRPWVRDRHYREISRDEVMADGVMELDDYGHRIMGRW